jgi:cystathionine beta-synthase
MSEYLTTRYKTDDEKRALYLIESFPLATILPASRDGGVAFVPMIRDEREPEEVSLVGHVDSENPVLAQLDGEPIQALFHGPNAYISPLDYESSQLPTWNYGVAHVSGISVLVHDEAEKLKLMVRMVETLEARDGSAYHLDVSDRRVRDLVRLVTFFRLRAQSVDGVFKYSQDKAFSDRVRAMQRLLGKLQATHGRTIARLADDVGDEPTGGGRSGASERIRALVTNGSAAVPAASSPTKASHTVGGRVGLDVLSAIGETPIVRLNRVAPAPAEFFAKLELMNPGGSIKDRIGRWLLEDAERRGCLQPGGLVVEGTGGNTGVGLAMAAAVKGYRCVFTVPDKMSEGKIRLLRAFGAEVVVTPTVAPPDPRNYCAVARRIAAAEPNAVYIDQYTNLANRECHYRTTGPEILRQLPDVDVLVAGLGTGGTLCGTARFLKEARPSITVIGVDPVGSILYDAFKRSCGHFQPYLMEGIGKDCVPANIDFDCIDDIVRVEDREAFLMTRRLLKQEGIYAGVSSGAALVGALRWARRFPDGLAGKRLLVILPDSGSRYLGKVYNDDWMREHDLLDDPPKTDGQAEVDHAVGH